MINVIQGMNVREKQAFTNVISEDTRSKKKLFHIFNTSQSFIGEICYDHLSCVSCSCKDKKNVGRVRELTNFYEKTSVNRSLDSPNDKLYKLSPSVLERIKNYEKKIV
ncbi:hypothetical protein NBO_353g0005 [Nosema bombycis CQ1]|uniref:Uncharacterized protein n=1 Tax=Nosema bombycis (strain CQ1 / CVCC 102059) TaxID=578461 RepID=R0MJC4_NOSB1|nr:hypothetical protein NBO_353g0005 [Nosema bombycis CQ1]|eukprot:EOB12863.1 hypothetical protein NBO_353g0005 [Nosema bombycis CQ1]